VFASSPYTTTYPYPGTATQTTYNVCVHPSFSDVRRLLTSTLTRVLVLEVHLRPYRSMTDNLQSNQFQTNLSSSNLPRSLSVGIMVVMVVNSLRSAIFFDINGRSPGRRLNRFAIDVEPNSQERRLETDTCNTASVNRVDLQVD